MPHDDKDFQIEPNKTPYPRRQKVNETYKKISKITNTNTEEPKGGNHG